MSSSENSAALCTVPHASRPTDVVAASAAWESVRVEMLMVSVYCAWEAATCEEASLALRWARQLLGHTRQHAVRDVDETTYVLGGQYLQAMICDRRRTANR